MENFKYTDIRFADIQILRYKLDGFEELPLKSKLFIYYLSEATLWGRDITFDQFGKYNLQIRKLLEAIFVLYDGDRESSDFKALSEYLRRVWFSSGIYHHYGCEKFVPGFSEAFFRSAVASLPIGALSSLGVKFTDSTFSDLCRAMFDADFLPKRVNLDADVDVVKASACNFYDGVTQKEVEDYYELQSKYDDESPVSHGLNTTVVKDDDGKIVELVWRKNGKYSSVITHIVEWLSKAMVVAQNDAQRQYISTLIDFYETGDLGLFNKYCIEWVQEQKADVDFVNGFIEVYGDPLGLKGSWEGIVEYKDVEATRRTKAISDNAQWFEENSPVDPRFKKDKVTGVVAHVVRAAMLGGDEYPSTAIGINLPNADWIRTRYGSKSVTISNLIDAYRQAANGNGFNAEFIQDASVIKMIDEYGDICDNLHTDLHECLGHGSGRMLDGVSLEMLKSYASTIEEARADLFGLYFIADSKLVELGFLTNPEAYKASYYTYILNGLLTQLVRIVPGNTIEEAHMRNRALIAHWCFEKGRSGNVIELYKDNGKTYLRINDYVALRKLFAELLAEIQRVKSEGDYEAARSLVEEYGVRVDGDLHKEVLERYSALGLAPYKGFLNPVLSLEYDEDGEIKNVRVDYSETYDDQMLRYGREYASL